LFSDSSEVHLSPRRHLTRPCRERQTTLSGFASVPMPTYFSKTTAVLLMMPQKHSSYNPAFPLLSCEQGVYYNKENDADSHIQYRIAEYHLNHYESAHAAFTQGHQLDVSDKSFEVWIKQCEEMMGGQTQIGSGNRVSFSAHPPGGIVALSMSGKRQPCLSATIRLASGENHNLNFHLLHPIVPEQSSFKILTTKVEFKIKKTDAIRWERLEGEGQETNIKHFNPNQYPSSSHYSRKWDKMVVDISEEEKSEKLEGDAALNKLFQQIYCDGSDEVKRAMNKSFMESGGTVLSTNWKDVGKRKVEMSPPDDVEFKKY
ncbi:hypothetical protein L3Q82_021754, partial [Scortum barcoo]